MGMWVYDLVGAPCKGQQEINWMRAPRNAELEEQVQLDVDQVK